MEDDDSLDQIDEKTQDNDNIIDDLMEQKDNRYSNQFIQSRESEELIKGLISDIRIKSPTRF